MKQQSFSDIEYANRRRKTKRESFLDSMNEIIPWSHWIDIIRPYYYNKKRGRHPIDIEIMLRMYLMQNWFNLSDEGMEEAIYDSYAMRSFLKINFIDEQVPDATTLTLMTKEDFYRKNEWYGKKDIGSNHRLNIMFDAGGNCMYLGKRGRRDRIREIHEWGL